MIINTKKLVLVAVFLMATSCSKQQPVNLQPASPTYNYSHQLQIGNQNLSVEIASTISEMQQGLSGRASMPENSGMLFDFGANANSSQAFWMKDMKFNLDFIWIANNKIVGITADVPAPVNCELLNVNCSLPTYSPPAAMNWVLEVNAGWAQKNNIKVGDEVKLIQ